MRRPLRLVFLGMMGQSPFGGQTWMHLHWLRGFQKLGHEVWYVEDSTAWPFDPIQNTVTDDCRYAVQHVAASMERIGLKDRWAYRLADRPDQSWGRTPAELRELFCSCDALLNITGGIDLTEEHLTAPLRVYIETDPVTNELRLAGGDKHTQRAFATHHHILTYGENYGAPDCGVPLCGLKFGKTRQPIDLDLWPMVFDPNARAFTTIGNWKQQGSDVVYNGQTYHWSKHHEWLKFIDLPRHTTQPFELAMKTDDAQDRELLEAHGWQLRAPLPMSLDVFGAYPAFIRQSRAEFTVSKDQNVRLRSGWFSERAVCYLASGKPVIAQETGFSHSLPTGAGLFAFSTMADALAAIEAINRDYERHCRSARKVAEEYFRAETIATQLLHDVGL